VDAAVDANSGEDAGPEDAGPEDAGPEDAGPCVLPLVNSLTVVEPTHPPLLAISFTTRTTCAGALDIAVGAFTQEIVVPAEAESVEFEYTGPRVPLVDGESQRSRDFIIGTVTLPLLMPVERLQPVNELNDNIARSITVAGDPHLDISNSGLVVFDSNDRALRAESPGNIFFWQPEGRRAQDLAGRPVIANVVRLSENMNQHAAPVISDDSRFVVFHDLTINKIMVQELGGPRPSPEELNIPMSGVPRGLYLDLRHVGGETYLLSAPAQGAESFAASVFRRLAGARLEAAAHLSTEGAWRSHWCKVRADFIAVIAAAAHEKPDHADGGARDGKT
jgi:hypothetical protein